MKGWGGGGGGRNPHSPAPADIKAWSISGYVLLSYGQDDRVENVKNIFAAELWLVL